jgi:PadR family transcriptional regulator PadR
MNSQFKRGIIELCVMSQLVREDMYGYLVISNVSRHLDVNDNTIYPILRRLTQDGLCETYLTESDQGAPRKYYRMTKKGFERYLGLRDEWDRFITGVYMILNEGGKNSEEVFERFKDRIG